MRSARIVTMFAGREADCTASDLIGTRGGASLAVPSRQSLGRRNRRLVFGGNSHSQSPLLAKERVRVRSARIGTMLAGSEADCTASDLVATRGEASLAGPSRAEPGQSLGRRNENAFFRLPLRSDASGEGWREGVTCLPSASRTHTVLSAAWLVC